jgi:hypothetical protein
VVRAATYSLSPPSRGRWGALAIHGLVSVAG